MDVNEHERLSNITLGHKFKQRTVCSKKEYGCKWTWETIQHYTRTQIQVKEQLVVRKDMDVNEHERLSNIILGHKFKKRNSL
jgi:hypothetical protein